MGKRQKIRNRPELVRAFRTHEVAEQVEVKGQENRRACHEPAAGNKIRAQYHRQAKGDIVP